MSDRVHVCATEDLSPGERRTVEVGQQEVGVFNVEGDYYAVANYCPHRGGPLCEGDVVPALVGEWPGPGERTEHTVTGDPSITCPWHGWEFDLESGDHLGDDTLSVPTYDVVDDDGDLYVEG
jgi:nitrite reductase/ring-hydroxylating ferredoxin subunit